MCEHLYLTQKITTFLPCKPQLEHVCIVTIVSHQQTTNQFHHTITLSHIHKLYDWYKWNNSMLMTESAAIQIVLTPCRGGTTLPTWLEDYSACVTHESTHKGVLESIFLIPGTTHLQCPYGIGVTASVSRTPPAPRHLASPFLFLLHIIEPQGKCRHGIR